MNSAPENEPEAIRSEIDTTRRRMDDTMDALGNRLKGRHLFDEILGFFRSDRTTGKAAELREKISSSASSAARSVSDTVKANPVPLLLIGAGVAWMVYSSRKKASSRYDDESYGTVGPYDPDTAYDQPLEYPTPAGDERSELETGDTNENGFFPEGQGDEDAAESGGGKLQQIKVGVVERATQAKDQIKDKLASASDRVRQKTQAAGQSVRDAGKRVQAKTREVYGRARTQVTATVEQHPLEVGLACLAAGVAAGLALPTPEKVNRLAGPAMDRARQRTRQAGSELVQKGKRVVSAATNAVKSEAQAQGLTLDRLRQKAGNVADRAKEAAGEAAEREGLSPASPDSNSVPGDSSPPESREPSPVPAANAGRGI